MKKLVVLGNSPAAIKAVDLLAEKATDFDVTIILHEETYPYKRDLFAAMLAKKVSAEDIFCHERKYYKTKGISVVNDKAVSRINLKTRKIHTEQKQQFDFDYLILAEMPEGTKLTDIKGGNKEGIYSLRKIKYVDRVIKEMPFFETVVIQSDTFAGFEQAKMFVEAGKEVYLIVPTQSPLACIKDEVAYNKLREVLAQKNLFVIENNMIEEILGDTQLKAVRLSSGKVIGADIVVLGEIDEDLKMIEEFGLERKDGRLVTDENCRTNIEGVFAVDAMRANPHSGWTDFANTILLEDEGRRVASVLIDGVSQESSSELIEQHFAVGEQTITRLFTIEQGYCGDASFYANAERSIFVEIVEYQGRVVGVCLINNIDQTDFIKNTIVVGEAPEKIISSLGLEKMDASASQEESGKSEDECSEKSESLNS